MTHTVHMDHPIRPGTAAKLGLRPPEPRPCGLLTFHRELTDDEIAEIRARWEAVTAKPSHGRFVSAPPEIRTELLPRRRPARRRWWRLRNR